VLYPEKMRQRRETVVHPFGTIKARMGATHARQKRQYVLFSNRYFSPPGPLRLLILTGISRLDF
jgi:hypothetical protein